MTDLENKLAFLTTVSSYKLYKQTSVFYPPYIKRYMIDGTKGMYGIHSIVYMMKVLWHEDIDWIIMIDEDAVLIDYNSILELVGYMNDKNYTVCGMQDGGVINIRHHSPIAINTYFSVINFKRLKDIWNEKEVLASQYLKKDEFDFKMSFLRYTYDKDSLFEAYYCFYFWLLRKGESILYLNAETPIEGDIYTNVLYNQVNKPILYHTWYARSYGKSREHTKRINKVLTKVKQLGNKSSKFVQPIIFKDDNFQGFVVKHKRGKAISERFKKFIKTLLSYDR